MAVEGGDDLVALGLSLGLDLVRRRLLDEALEMVGDDDDDASAAALATAALVTLRVDISATRIYTVSPISITAIHVI